MALATAVVHRLLIFSALLPALVEDPRRKLAALGHMKIWIRVAAHVDLTADLARPAKLPR